MAIHRIKLHQRIKGQAANHSAAMGGAHPAGGPQTVYAMPLSLVTVTPYDNNYVTLAMQELAPIFTADGAAIPATMPGRWDQLRQAGRT